MDLQPCFQCGFRTLDRREIVPGGKPLPLCRVCQRKLKGKGDADAFLDGQWLGRVNYVLSDELAADCIRLRREGMPFKRIAEILGIAVGTVFKACRNKV